MNTESPKSAVAYEPAIDELICDPLSGIVRSCFELPLEPADPRVWCFFTAATDTGRYGLGLPTCNRFGCAVGLTREWAIGAAVGECVERYSAAVYDSDDVSWSSYNDLAQEAVAPEKFALFSANQYSEFSQLKDGVHKYYPFTRETVTGWIPGFSMTRRKETLVPAALVYLPYRKQKGEPHLVDSISTGLACARTRDAAALNALYEAVERDAIAIAWFNSMVLPRVQLDLNDRVGNLYMERFLTPGTSYILLNFTLDIPIPTFCGFLIDERGGTIISSATRLDPYDAAKKALLEAAQGKVAWKRELTTGPPERFSEDFHDVVDFPNHSKVYMLKEMRKHIEFLWGSNEKQTIQDIVNLATGNPSEDLQTCVDLLAKEHLETILVDVTSNDIREAGYWVIRAVIPGLQGINARHVAPLFGGNRLYEVPYKTGYSSQMTTEEELNRFLHPFP